MELNVTKMSFKGFRLGYSARHQLTPKEKVIEMQGKSTTPASMNLFKKFIQNNKANKTSKTKHN